MFLTRAKYSTASKKLWKHIGDVNRIYLTGKLNAINDAGYSPSRVEAGYSPSRVEAGYSPSRVQAGEGVKDVESFANSQHFSQQQQQHYEEGNRRSKAYTLQFFCSSFGGLNSTSGFVQKHRVRYFDDSGTADFNVGQSYTIEGLLREFPPYSLLNSPPSVQQSVDHTNINLIRILAYKIKELPLIPINKNDQNTRLLKEKASTQDSLHVVLTGTILDKPLVLPSSRNSERCMLEFWIACARPLREGATIDSPSNDSSDDGVERGVGVARGSDGEIVDRIRIRLASPLGPSKQVQLGSGQRVLIDGELRQNVHVLSQRGIRLEEEKNERELANMEKLLDVLDEEEEEEVAAGIAVMNPNRRVRRHLYVRANYLQILGDD